MDNQLISVKRFVIIINGVIQFCETGYQKDLQNNELYKSIDIQRMCLNECKGHIKEIIDFVKGNNKQQRFNVIVKLLENIRFPNKNDREISDIFKIQMLYYQSVLYCTDLYQFLCGFAEINNIKFISKYEFFLVPKWYRDELILEYARDKYGCETMEELNAAQKNIDFFNINVGNMLKNELKDIEAPQEPAKAIISKTDALNEVNNGVNTCKYKCTEKLPLIKIYKYLIDTDTIKKDISETQFINDCHNADFSKEYATGKRANMCYVATVLCDYYVPNEGINDDWRTAVTKSMGVDKNYIKGRNWSDLFADKFPLKRKN
jgi:hypothetical protein